MSKNNKLKWIIPLVAVVVLLVIPFISASSYVTSLLTSICIYSIFAISYDLLLGYTGIASFGHALYFGLGAYILAYTTVRLHWPVVLALVMVLVVCVIISFVISFITVRVKNLYFNMVTMALGQLFYVMSTKYYKITGGDDGLPGVKPLIANKTGFYILVVIILAVVFLFCHRVVNSPAGSVLKAIKNNEERTGLLGYNVLKYKTLIIQISGIIAGLAGVLYVSSVRIAYPTMLHSSLTLQALFMVVLGGTGTLYGGVIGAVIMKIAESALSGITTRWMLILGIVFIVVILFFPSGTAGIFKKLASRKKKTEQPPALPETKP